jgi:hypothetical protein
MNWVHRCLIVPAEHADLARVLCATLAGPGGSGMFTTPLSLTGQEPATHFISSGAIEEPFAQLLPLAEFPEGAEPVIYHGQPELIAQTASARGIAVTLEEVQALLAASDVSEQEAFAALARLKLQIVNSQDII